MGLEAVWSKEKRRRFHPERISKAYRRFAFDALQGDGTIFYAHHTVANCGTGQSKGIKWCGGNEPI